MSKVHKFRSYVTSQSRGKSELDTCILRDMVFEMVFESFHLFHSPQSGATHKTGHLGFGVPKRWGYPNHCDTASVVLVRKKFDYFALY